MNIDKYEDQLLTKKLEIENLNLKINPHLLYNSLSVIKMGLFKKCDFETVQNFAVQIQGKGEPVEWIPCRIGRCVLNGFS